MEDLEARLVDSEDDGAIRAGQLVEMIKQLHGGGGIEACRKRRTVSSQSLT